MEVAPELMSVAPRYCLKSMPSLVYWLNVPADANEMFNPELRKLLEITAVPPEQLKPIPDKDTLVIRSPNEFLLEALKRATALAVQEQPTCRVSPGLPLKFSRCTYILMSKIPSMQYAMSSSRVVTLFATHIIRLAMLTPRIASVERRLSTGIRVTSEMILASDPGPTRCENYDILRGQQLLERPSSGEPVALRELCSLDVGVVQDNVMDILEIGIAHLGSRVEAEHGVDGFGKLGAVTLVDAVCVDPQVFQIVYPRLHAGLLDARFGRGPPATVGMSPRRCRRPIGVTESRTVDAFPGSYGVAWLWCG